ncbi:VOC family protein [Paenibacillus apiarius]|uniref:VOC family protein n=1 Tax=Paenibacillus apiarius TaxID=46240 RepID=UPI001980FB7F|nr:hypothetical protein [Paenibacillus apiarius]MBN3525643.1 hypothetical protein [Paenibacillus apiarius]
MDSFLIISGEENAVERFTSTSLTITVDSLSDARNFLVAQGAGILEEPKEVPTGKNMRIRHIDGIIVEYVEHRKRS